MKQLLLEKEYKNKLTLKIVGGIKCSFIKRLGNYSKLFTLAFVFMLLGNGVYAQRDTNYIGSYERPFGVRVFFADNYLALSQDINSSTSKSYLPNHPLTLGVGIAYEGTELNIGYGFKIFDGSKHKHTKTLLLDYHYYGKKLVIDFYGQSYKGYFINNRDENKKDPTRYDMRIFKFSLIGQYFFNYKRFSPRAAFDQSEDQKRSAGSLIVGGGLYLTRISADSIMLIEGSTRRNSFHIAPSVGYVYSFIIKRNFHLTGSLSLAADLVIKNPKGKVGVTPLLMPRLSGGYNVDKWGLNLTYDGNRMYLLFSGKEKVALRSGITQLTYTRRFNYRPKLFEKISNWMERKNLVDEDV